jgi:hypothetical protein
LIGIHYHFPTRSLPRLSKDINVPVPYLRKIGGGGGVCIRAQDSLVVKTQIYPFQKEEGQIRRDF